MSSPPTVQPGPAGSPAFSPLTLPDTPESVTMNSHRGHEPQSAAQPPQLSPHSQAPSPQIGRQSSGQLEQVSPSRHRPSPQNPPPQGPQSRLQVSQLSLALHSPLPQQEPQSSSQLAQSSLRSHWPSPQAVGSPPSGVPPPSPPPLPPSSSLTPSVFPTDESERPHPNANAKSAKLRPLCMPHRIIQRARRRVLFHVTTWAP